MQKWQILLNNLSLGGFAPAWYKETYPSFGNKNQAGNMVNIDQTNPGYMTQGAGLATLTAGTEAAAITTLIKGATDFAVTSNVAYGTGGNKLYQFSATAVTTTSPFADSGGGHVIDKAAVTAELGEDVAYYKSNLYYSYNHSGSAGDIGIYDLATTFDDDWGSTVPTGMATLTSNPHQMIVGGDDILYIANGRYVGTYNGTTLDTTALDLPTNSVIQSIAWNSDRLWIAAIRPNLTGSNKNTASIYVWDGAATSWEMEIRVMGTVGGLHVKNGVLFLFYQDITSTGGYKLAYVNAGVVMDLENFSGGLPAFYQITDYKDFIVWNSNGLLFAFGSGDKDLPARLFQLADGGFSTVGCVICPFGTPMIASTQSTSFKLAQFSGYDVVSSWKSLMFDIAGDNPNNPGKINSVRINFEKLTSGARVDWSLVNNQGIVVYPRPASGNTTEVISFAKLGAVTSVFYPMNGLVCENFQIVFDYASGSASVTVPLKSVKVYGES